MPLTLVVGPAHAGKVALLLERYLAVVDADPWLLVPNRSDIPRVETDLLRRAPALLAGRIGTFDDLFAQIAGDEHGTMEAGPGARALVLRSVVERTELGALSASAGTRGFNDALSGALAEIGSSLLDKSALGGSLGELARTYDDELARLGLRDRDRVRRRAVDRLRSDLDAWGRTPVLAYGFEDLTAAEWELIEALSARAEVTVSLPYEPGRSVFSSLRRTAEDLSGIAREIIELPPRSEALLPASIAHLERHLFTDVPPAPPPLDGTIRFFEGAGARGTLELVGEDVIETLRSGVPAQDVAIVVESVERWRAPLATVFGALGIPFAVDEPLRLPQTPFGHALLSLLRFAWQDASRAELFAFLRSPFSGLGRPAVDFVEGRLRGRAVHDPDRVVTEATRLRGAPVPLLDAVRTAPRAVEASLLASTAMITAAYGLERPSAAEETATDLRAHQAVIDALDDLRRYEERAAVELRPEAVLSALERQIVRAAPNGEHGRVAVLDLMRARTRRFDTVFVLGLEEGALPRRGRGSPFLDDDARRLLGARLERPDPVERDRYLFYTACTRTRRRLVLVREAAGDDGAPTQPSPFWQEVTALFDPDHLVRWTRRRPLSALTWSLEEAPTERERLRAVARVAAADGAAARELAAANGWLRRLDRARRAFDRTTRLRSPAVLEWLAQRTSFAVTELERFADCSSAWLFERVVSPRTIDAEPDAMLRGQVAHTALNRFYQALPKELGVDMLTPALEEQGVALMRRCLDDALASGVRIDLTDVQAIELRQSLLRDLEGFVRDECASRLTLVPRRLEVAFGSDRAAPELQRGLPLGDGLTLSGKIDRIDVDPFSASGIVQDYKSGKGAHSAREIDSEFRLQIPLYLLVLRDLVGLEPLGGVYRALAGKRSMRGMLRAEAADILPGFSKHDYLDDDAFWDQVETARDRAAEFAKRIRAGDVAHDPKNRECPPWCDLWTMCRVARA